MAHLGLSLVSLFIQQKTTQPLKVTIHNGLCPPPSINNEDSPLPQICPQAYLIWQFLDRDSILQLLWVVSSGQQELSRTLENEYVLQSRVVKPQMDMNLAETLNELGREGSRGMHLCQEWPKALVPYSLCFCIFGWRAYLDSPNWATHRKVS